MGVGFLGLKADEPKLHNPITLNPSYSGLLDSSNLPSAYSYLEKEGR